MHGADKKVIDSSIYKMCLDISLPPAVPAGQPIWVVHDPGRGSGRLLLHRISRRGRRDRAAIRIR